MKRFTLALLASSALSGCWMLAPMWVSGTVTQVGTGEAVQNRLSESPKLVFQRLN